MINCKLATVASHHETPDAIDLRAAIRYEGGETRMGLESE